MDGLKTCPTCIASQSVRENSENRLPRLDPPSPRDGRDLEQAVATTLTGTLKRSSRYLRGSERRLFAITMHRITVTLTTIALLAGHVAAEEHVVVQREGTRQQVDGKVVVEAADGGLLLLARNGVLWTILPDEIASRKADDVAFRTVGRNNLIAEIRKELPSDFDIYETNHYVIAYNTSRAYAQWCGSLYERLYRGFYNFWRRKGFELIESDLPLIALVFNDRGAYLRHSAAELGQANPSIVGYYHMGTNRMTMYDITGIEGLRAPGKRLRSSAVVNQVLSQPRAESSVATLVHEATHQLAYNSGLQTRYADNPVWVSEGLAVYFETPDLSSSKGWKGIGGINRKRLLRFQQFLQRRPPDSLSTLLRTDDRLRNADEALDAYAESWALCYYLLKQRQSEFIAYLQELAQKQPLVFDEPEQRVRLFAKHLGISGSSIANLSALYSGNE